MLLLLGGIFVDIDLRSYIVQKLKDIENLDIKENKNKYSIIFASKKLSFSYKTNSFGPNGEILAFEVCCPNPRDYLVIKLFVDCEDQEIRNRIFQLIQIAPKPLNLIDQKINNTKISMPCIYQMSLLNKSEWNLSLSKRKELISEQLLLFEKDYLPMIENAFRDFNKLSLVSSEIKPNIVEVSRSRESNLKANPRQDLINISYDDYLKFEHFFQYGDLANADYIFVGREEGLGREDVATNIKRRLDWANNKPFYIRYIGEDNSSGYYIYDVDAADKALGKKPILPDATMRFQSRVKLLLDNDNDVSLANQEDLLLDVYYHTLNRPTSNTAMLDFYPIPMQNNFPFDIEGLGFSTYRNVEKFREYCHSESSSRIKILKYMYDNFKMRVSIVYAGISNSKFRLQEFYEEIVFSFDQYDTSMVHPSYLGRVDSSDKPKPFLIGKRSSKQQWAFLTPFFGGGQLSFNDIDVIATWIPR
jgi:hypothetical protein